MSNSFTNVSREQQISSLGLCLHPGQSWTECIHTFVQSHNLPILVLVQIYGLRHHLSCVVQLHV